MTVPLVVLLVSLLLLAALSWYGRRYVEDDYEWTEGVHDFVGEESPEYSFDDALDAYIARRELNKELGEK